MADQVGNNGHSPEARRTGVTPQVLAEIRSMIDEEGYQPGSRLPSERQLAAMFSVGRPAVREAIKALSILDLLESRHGGGTFVKSLSALEHGWSAGHRNLRMEFDLFQLPEVRKMFEPAAAGITPTT